MILKVRVAGWKRTKYVGLHSRFIKRGGTRGPFPFLDPTARRYFLSGEPIYLVLHMKPRGLPLATTVQCCLGGTQFPALLNGSIQPKFCRKGGSQLSHSKDAKGNLNCFSIVADPIEKLVEEF